MISELELSVVHVQVPGRPLRLLVSCSSPNADSFDTTHERRR